ncbi:hypothetical protein DEI81_00745 [Curtobacterium sp. MCBD17_013]|uniref:hypothetical protein n=1 Tax=unclassified Curtobacterium TaxID=257496 RepID=UPI000DA814DE|nr:MULTISPECIES: hypothetical protein [unclassified Curtobacterium]PZF66194.1 hypothetical protein DEI81_00745 [Curtobacterium sp. MCBD17_013]WIB68582.1 hypothetical protein DEI93_05970 [Curtobacterium sp. MCBD17_035]
MAGNLPGRSIHDLTAAAWFGGSLMGAIGLNGAAARAKDPEERTRLTTIGWRRWGPIQTGAVVLHLLADLDVTAHNAPRSAVQHGMHRINTYKAVVTLVGAGVTLWTAVVGNRYGKLVEADARKGQPAAGATEPAPGTSPELARVQRKLQRLQWLQAIFGGWIIVVGAKEGEMQRPHNVAKGVVRKALRRR